jgi:import receptor subunit TOM20
MSSPTPSIPTSTIITATIGGALTLVLGYAIYFDYKRRTDAEFRRQLKKESRKIEKAAKEEKEMEGKKRRTEIRQAVDRVNAEGVPKDAEEVEGYFMEEVAEGERLCQDGEFVFVFGSMMRWNGMAGISSFCLDGRLDIEAPWTRT